MEFQHQQLQESETAESLLQQLPHLSDEQLKQEYLNARQWTEPLSLILPLLDDKSQALRLVKLALDVDLCLGARLAGVVKPEFQAATVDLLAGLELPELLKIRLLGSTSADKAVLQLLQVLHDENSRFRPQAVSALGTIGSEAAVAALGEALNDQDLEVRAQVAYELGQIGSEAGVAVLQEALNDNDYQVRESAALALSAIATDTAVAALQQALNHKSPNFRERVVSALGQIGLMQQ
jgi:hypothetical protein